jgi:hypothetical protein
MWQLYSFGPTLSNSPVTFPTVLEQVKRLVIKFCCLEINNSKVGDTRNL